jgi:hypothetical protein
MKKNAFFKFRYKLGGGAAIAQRSRKLLMKNFYLLIAVLALTACAHQTFQDVKIGMNQEEMVAIAGQPDSVIASHKIDEDLVEIFEYHEAGLWWGDLEESYWFYFVNGKLEKWQRPGDYLRYVDALYID